LGLPRDLLSMGFHFIVALTFWLSSISFTWPYRANLWDFINLTIFSQSFHTYSETHPVSYAVGPRGKAFKPETDHSPPSSAEVKNEWVFTHTPPYTFMWAKGTTPRIT
jgi:hypothetical protein